MRYFDAFFYSISNIIFHIHKNIIDGHFYDFIDFNHFTKTSEDVHWLNTRKKRQQLYLLMGKIEFDFEVVKNGAIKLNKKERRHYFWIEIYNCFGNAGGMDLEQGQSQSATVRSQVALQLKRYMLLGNSYFRFLHTLLILVLAVLCKICCKDLYSKYQVNLMEPWCFSLWYALCLSLGKAKPVALKDLMSGLGKLSFTF